MVRSVLAALGLFCLALAPTCQASDKALSPKPSTTKSAKVEPKAPTWQQLTPQQKQLLAELATQWDQQPDRLRNSLIKVANKYPKMKPDEQQRVRRRITRWASLTPEQREIARQRYQKIKTQPPEKQKEVKQKWEKYKAQKQSEPTAQPLLEPDPDETGTTTVDEGT